MTTPAAGAAQELPPQIAQSPLFNPDLAPTQPAQRTWNMWHLASLWVGMSVCIPTYMLASNLLAQGLDWTRAILVIFLGNFIVLIPMVLIGHAGTRYGIPLPVLLRAPFGTAGAHVPSVMRALVACGWFGIQTWIGGKALYELARLVWPLEGPVLHPFLGLNAAQAVCFLLFWALNVWFVVKGTESIKWLETLAAPVLLAIGLALLAWGWSRGDGLGRVLAHSENFTRPAIEAVRQEAQGSGGIGLRLEPVRIDGVPRAVEAIRWASTPEGLEQADWVDPAGARIIPDPGGEELWVQARSKHGTTTPQEVPIRSPGHRGGGLDWLAFCAAITAMVGYWATLALNIPDFTRYARSQRDQVLGQALGLPTTMTLYAFIGVAVTCSTLIVFDDVLFPFQAPWDPIELLARFRTPVLVVAGMICLAVATLTTNIAANVVAPANVFSNLHPRAISFRTAGLLTAVIGVLMMPWKLAEDPTGYIYTWLIGYSALLGPIAGILLADYLVVRRGRLDLAALYRPSGVDVGAVAILIVAILPNLPGFLQHVAGLEVPAFWGTLFRFAWFVGFVIAFVLQAVYGTCRRTRTS